MGYIGFTQFYPWVKLTVLPSFTQFYPIGFTRWVKLPCQPCVEPNTKWEKNENRWSSKIREENGGIVREGSPEAYSSMSLEGFYARCERLMTFDGYTESAEEKNCCRHQFSRYSAPKQVNELTKPANQQTRRIAIPPASCNNLVQKQTMSPAGFSGQRCTRLISASVETHRLFMVCLQRPWVICFLFCFIRHLIDFNYKILRRDNVSGLWFGHFSLILLDETLLQMEDLYYFEADGKNKNPLQVQKTKAHLRGIHERRIR